MNVSVHDKPNFHCVSSEYFCMQLQLGPPHCATSYFVISTA